MLRGINREKKDSITTFIYSSGFFDTYVEEW